MRKFLKRALTTCLAAACLAMPVSVQVDAAVARNPISVTNAR